MLQPNGESILRIIGKGDAAQLKQGILLPQDMPRAITALQLAVQQEEQARAEEIQIAQSQGQKPAPSPAIGLRQRSLPFIQMLERCLAEKKEVVWGV